MIWVGVGLGGVSLVGLGVLGWLYLKMRGDMNRFLVDLDKVLNTGRGWEKRWKVCQEMFAKKTFGM